MAGNFLAKTIGLAAIGIVGYDSVTTANRQSSRYASSRQIDRVNDVYLRTDSLDNESAVAAGMQKWARNWHHSNNWLFRGFDKICAYTGSLFNQLGNNLITLGLGALAIFCTKGQKALPQNASLIKKGISALRIPIVGKIAAGLLAIKAGKFVLCDLFGLGAGDPKRTEFI